MVGLLANIGAKGFWARGQKCDPNRSKTFEKLGQKDQNPMKITVSQPI